MLKNFEHFKDKDHKDIQDKLKFISFSFPKLSVLTASNSFQIFKLHSSYLPPFWSCHSPNGSASLRDNEGLTAWLGFQRHLPSGLDMVLLTEHHYSTQENPLTVPGYTIPISKWAPLLLQYHLHRMLGPHLSAYPKDRCQCMLVPVHLPYPTQRTSLVPHSTLPTETRLTPECVSTKTSRLPHWWKPICHSLWGSPWSSTSTQLKSPAPY